MCMGMILVLSILVLKFTPSHVIMLYFCICLLNPSAISDTNETRETAMNGLETVKLLGMHVGSFASLVYFLICSTLQQCFFVSLGGNSIRKRVQRNVEYGSFWCAHLFLLKIGCESRVFVFVMDMM